MSERLRHKMIDFTVVPPPAAWESIAVRLDDDRKYAGISSTLNKFEASPPPAAWESIEFRLNDDQKYAVISSTLNNFEADPPPAAWESIALRLNDDRKYAALASNLGNFEAAPPPQVWNNIASALTTTDTETTPVINIRRIIYRALAAAVIIGVVTGGWMLINKNDIATNLVKSNTGHTPVAPSGEEHHKTANDSIANTEEQGSVALQNQPAQNNDQSANAALPAAAVDKEGRPLKYAVVNTLPAFREMPVTISSNPIVDENGVVIRDMDLLTTNSNYILVTGPNGQQTRISSKFASVIRYLNGSPDDNEEYLDRVIKESDTWKKRFQEWRSKISQSSFIPSSANFLDIMEFKELIQEKQ